MSATVVPVAHPSLLGFQLGEEFWIFAAQDFQPSTFLLFKRQGFAGDPSIFSFSTELDWLLEELDDGQVLDLYRLSGREIETHWLFGSTQNDLRELIMSGELRAFKLDEQTARRMSNRNDTIFSDATGYESTESSPVNALRAQLADKFAKDLEEFWIGKDKADKLHWDKNAIHRELVEAVDSGAEVVDFAYDTIVGILDLLIFAIEVTAEVVVARAQVKMLAQRAFANYLKGNQEAARKDLEAIGIKVDGWMKSAETVAAKIQQGLDLFNLMMNDPLTRQLLTDYLDARYESLPFRDSRTVPTRLVLEVGVEVLLALASGGGSTLAKVSAKAGKAFSAGAVKAAKLSRIGPFTLEMIDLMCDMARLMRKAEMKADDVVEEVRIYPESRKDKKEGVRDSRPSHRTIKENFGNNEATWTVDENGLPISVEATLKETSSVARSSAEKELQGSVGGEARLSDDDGGHMVGHRFMADQGEKNLFPQNSNLNRSAYKKMENEWADWTSEGFEVRLKVELDPPGAARPDTVFADYEVYDPSSGRKVFERSHEFDNIAGQEFDRMPKADISKYRGK